MGTYLERLQYTEEAKWASIEVAADGQAPPQKGLETSGDLRYNIPNLDG